MLFSPTIPALRRQADIPCLMDCQADTVFLMFGKLHQLEKLVRQVESYGKKVFLHTDLIKGLNQDKEATRFIAECIAPEGIVTTKSFVIKQAKNVGLKTVHHLFLIDTNAFESGIKNVKLSKPDAIEIMPGLMPSVINRFQKEVNVPLLVGGLVKSIDDMNSLWEAGAHSVVTGSTDLWAVNRNKSWNVI